MKEVQKLLKMVSEGLKTLAQGVEAIAEKVDETIKTKSAGKDESKKRPASVKTAKTVSKKQSLLKRRHPKSSRRKQSNPLQQLIPC